MSLQLLANLWFRSLIPGLSLDLLHSFAKFYAFSALLWFRVFGIFEIARPQFIPNINTLSHDIPDEIHVELIHSFMFILLHLGIERVINRRIL